jgi:hypothetical protein
VSSRLFFERPGSKVARSTSHCAATANNTKNCLASWLHSAETEAIACRSKVIGGRIYDARDFVASFSASRNLQEMSSVDFTLQDLPQRVFIIAKPFPTAYLRLTVITPAKALLSIGFILSTAAVHQQAMRNVSHCRRKTARIARQDRCIVETSPTQSKVVA